MKKSSEILASQLTKLIRKDAWYQGSGSGGGSILFHSSLGAWADPNLLEDDGRGLERVQEADREPIVF